MERPGAAKQSPLHASNMANGYDNSPSALNVSTQSHFTQYSPLGRQRSFYPQYAQYRSPRRPVKVFRYDCEYPVHIGDWGMGNYVALSTFNETKTNFIYLLHAQYQDTYDFEPAAQAEVTMPQTRVAWSPLGDLKLLSSSDALRLWQLDATRNQLTPLASLAKHSKTQPNALAAPLTSFDWNKLNPNMVLTSSVDTTCTVWDLNAQTVTTQLIAHDQEVFDASFLHESQHQFVSVGCDGSARLFDLRSLDNSTIIYESHPSTPMLRIEASPHDPNIIAAFGQDQHSVVLLDIRATRNPVKILEGHQAPLNSMKWLPKSASNSESLLATGADDCQILLWDVLRGSVVGCHTEIQQVNSVLASPDGCWLGSVYGKSLQSVSTQLA